MKSLSRDTARPTRAAEWFKDAKGPTATMVSQLAVGSRPGVGSGMRRTNWKKPAGASAPQADPAVHTFEQRETMQTGLRILARIIARANLERQLHRAAGEE